MDNNLRNLSKRVISLIERRLREEFDFRVQMGAELEFSAFSDGKINAIPIFRQKRDDYRPAKDQGFLEKPDFFRESPYISNFYKEEGDYKYELVFTHAASHGSPIVLARAIEGAKREIVKKASSYGVERVIFEPKSPYKDLFSGKEITHAFHINFSLLDRLDKNIFEKKDYLPPLLPDALAACINENMLNVLNELMVFMAPNEQSYDRYNSDSIGPPKELGVISAIHMRLGTNHIENRLAGSDADPYLVIAANLIAIYFALHQQQDIQIYEDGNITLTRPNRKYEEMASFPLPQNKSEAIDRFRSGTIVRDLLNEISGRERLGDKYCNAVLEYMTGKKKSLSRWIIAA